MPDIRLAEEGDVTTIIAFDHVAREDAERQQFVKESVRTGSASVAVIDGQVVAYVVLDYKFYSQGFIDMLYVHPDHRRKGIGASLVRHAESICATPKLFTSTNESNLPMQALMVALGYVPSGVINNLDEGDPKSCTSRG